MEAKINSHFLIFDSMKSDLILQLNTYQTELIKPSYQVRSNL